MKYIKKMKIAWPLAGMVLLLYGSEAQQSPAHHSDALKPYSYESDSFEISAPQVPKITNLKDDTEYLVYWDEESDVVISVMVRRATVDCPNWVNWAKGLKGNVIRMITFKGAPALEGWGNRNSLQAGYRIDQCVAGRLYSLESGWPKGEPKPRIVENVMSSFKVLQRSTN